MKAKTYGLTQIAMAERINTAGGKIIDKGEFVPGEPYIFFKDPDGYEVEIAYELVNG